MSSSSSADGATVAEYRVLFDDAYFRAVLARIRPVPRIHRWLTAVFLTGASILFVFMAIIAIAAGDWWKAAAPGVLFVGYLAFIRIRAPAELAQIRRSVDYGNIVFFRVTPVGVDFAGRLAASSTRWIAYERAVADAEGLLLLQRDNAAVWLPDAALTRGTADAVRDLVLREISVASASR